MTASNSESRKRAAERATTTNPHITENMIDAAIWASHMTNSGHREKMRAALTAALEDRS